MRLRLPTAPSSSAVLSALARLPGLEPELRLLPRLIGAGAACVDIGAAHGAYCVPMSYLVGEGGRVLAVEPRPDAARRLERLGVLLGLSPLRVAAAAVGDRVGAGELVVPRRRWPVTGRSYLGDDAVCHALDDGLRPGVMVQVDVTTLDRLRMQMGRPIDFIKCDVEGAELQVIAGGHHVLQRDRPVLLCEVEARHAQRYGRGEAAVFDEFERLGYVALGGATPEWSARNHLFVPDEQVAAVRARTGWVPLDVQPVPTRDAVVDRAS